MKLLPVVALLVFCFLAGFLPSAFAQAPPKPPLAKPVDAVTAIIDAFRTYDIVALGEGSHGNEQSAFFREKLYRDTRFQAAVNDIVVESGNARHQALMDRYISGESVSEKEVRIAWLETTAPTETWDGEIYVDFFRAIREINQKLPKERRFRVLLGGSPYDPATALPGPGATDDKFTADLIQREVMAKKRKALVIYGGIHFLRRFPERNVMPSGELSPEPYSIVSLLEKAGAEVFVIWPFAASPGEELTALQPAMTSWPKETLALIKDTRLGLASLLLYYPKGSAVRMTVGPNGPVVADMAESIGGIMQEQVDAVLYMGPKTGITFTKLPKELCADPEYVEMRAKRLADDEARYQRLAPVRAANGGPPPVASLEAAFRAKCKAVLEAN